MRVAIVNNNTQQSIAIKKKIIEKISQTNIIFDDHKPDIVITVGGDGTLLHAFHLYNHQLDTVRFVGVHTGHLGFYTDWQADELDQFIGALVMDQGESVSYPLLEVRLIHNDGHNSRKIALNESTIRRYEGTMTCQVFIKDEQFELFKGDGLCVSTPTGSTGLNKSLGGAVVHPRLDTIQLTEIASLNNRVYRSLSSSMLIASDEWIVLKPDEEQPVKGVFMSVDQENFELINVHQVEFRVAKERVHFARYRHMHFWNRVEEGFIGLHSRRCTGRGENW